MVINLLLLSTHAVWVTHKNRERAMRKKNTRSSNTFNDA